MDVREILNKAKWEFRHHRKVALIGLAVLIFLGVEITVTMAVRSSLGSAKTLLTHRTRETQMAKTTGLAQISAAELAKLQQRMNTFKEGFVSGAEISGVLNRISDQAEKNNVRVVSINSEDPVSMKTDSETEEKFTRFPIRMNLEGRYQAIAEFLHSLGQSSRQMFVVESYKITKSKEGDALNCEMVLSYFWGS